MLVLIYTLRHRRTASVYIGQTNNLNKRLADHAAKVNGNCGTGTTTATIAVYLRGPFCVPVLCAGIVPALCRHFLCTAT